MGGAGGGGVCTSDHCLFHSQEATLRQQLEGAQGAGAELGGLREELRVALAERQALQQQMDQAAASLQAEKQR